MDTDNFIAYIYLQLTQICRYVDIVKDVETRVYTLNYELNGAFSNVKSKNIIGLMKKNQVGRK